MVRDSLRYYIQSCAASDSDSYLAFNPLSSAVFLYAPKDTTRYDSYREWLLSVLYLNTTNPSYYCSCVYAIAGTYQYGKYALPNAGLAVIMYLRSIKTCDDAGLEREINSDINARHQNWLQNKQFGDTTAEDTALPPLDSIGLGILLGHESVGSTIPLVSGWNLHTIVFTPNPFVYETTLHFTLTRMTYITIAVFDELGRVAWGDGKGSSLDAGTHTITLDGTNLPHGTLYARISTGFGEVRTVKLVHD
ncbi:MAG: hypothetical protein Q8896_14285 [Bacteroidota bacterium]|nr:hypothetical protein [Bacteroidota bacterium]